MSRYGDNHKGGRPKADFDTQLFESLCHIWCTIDEICYVLRTKHTTLDKWCQRTYEVPLKEAKEMFGAGGKAALRRNQFNLAKKNAAMAIWLGKQVLGQKDIPVVSEEFNGQLGAVLDNLLTLKNQRDFKKQKVEDGDNKSE